MEEINIEEIMDEIRKDIKERGLTDDMLSFQDVSCEACSFTYENDEYISLLKQMNNSNCVPWYRELSGGRIKRFIKKTIRKVVSLILLPMSEEQNLFNSLVTREFNQLAGYVTQQDEIIDVYRKEIDILQKKIDALEEKIG